MTKHTSTGLKALSVFFAVIAILMFGAGKPAAAQTKLVFAHYMITNQDYGANINGDKVQGYEKEIQQAQAAGIDGFILNCGGWISQTYYITYTEQMFQAALNLNSGFKLFMSCDFCCGNGVNDAEDMMRRLCNDPNYSKVYFQYNGKYVLTTFDGAGQIGTGGFSQIRSDLTNGTNPNPVPGGFSQSSTAPLSVYIIPAFFWGGEVPTLSSVQSGYNQWSPYIDGSVYWGIAGVPGSGGSIDQIPSSEYYAQTVHGGGKQYMAPVTFQFWGANANRYFEYSGYSGLRKMWMDAINNTHPEWVEIITWNDFVEGTYASPIDDPNAYPNSNYLQFGNTGFYHTHNGATALMPYFISWYKNGTAPTITQDSIYWAYRTQPMSVNTGNPSVANIYGPISDSIYVTANLTSAATIKVTCGSNVQTINAAAGSNDYAVPFTAGSTPNFQVIRGSSTEINVNGTDQIQTSPSLNDYYYSTGSASTAPQGTQTEAPYGGTAAAIPGTIQAENYDTGGEGLAYHDSDAVNSGGQYRTDGVDIETTSDTGGGYDVGWNMAGEWQKFTVDVASAGNYNVTFRVANGTTANGGFHLQNSGGTNLTGAVTVAPTGGWQTWANVTSTVNLPAGTQTLTLSDDGGNYNINYMTFAAQASAPSAPSGLGATAGNAQNSLSWSAGSGATSYNIYRGTSAGGEGSTAIGTATGTSYTDTGLTNGTAYYYKVAAVNSSGTSGMSNEASGTPTAPSSGEGPYGGTAAAIPGTVQAENYDTGGEGVAYHDADAVNNGGQYRTSDGVDIETCSDTGGGYDVGWTNAGEWMKYTVNVAAAGTYTVTFRVANGTTGNGSFHLQNAAGSNLSGSITVAPTGGWQTWASVTATVTLPAGQQVLTFYEDTSNFNINSMAFASGSGGGVSGSLTGSVSAVTGNDPLNITSLGTSDWAVYGYNNNVFEHSSSGGSQISTVSTYGGGSPYCYNNAGYSYFPLSWTNGTPDASVSGEQWLYCNAGGVGDGFQFTVPASTTSHKLMVYVGGWSSGGTLTATLSDGSAASYSDSSQSNSANSYYAVYTLTYNAASAGKTLTIVWKQASGTGNLCIFGAALQ